MVGAFESGREPTVSTEGQRRSAAASAAARSQKDLERRERFHRQYLRDRAMADRLNHLRAERDLYLERVAELDQKIADLIDAWESLTNDEQHTDQTSQAD